MTLQFSPRRIFLVRSWRDDLANQLRADGHQVTDAATGSRPDGEDLRAADTVVACPPLLSQGYFAVGAAWAARKLLLVVADRQDSTWLALEPLGLTLAPTDEDLRDLLRRWDPVSKTFRPRPGTVVRYRHRLTGEVRDLRQKPRAIETGAIDLIDMAMNVETVTEGRGLAFWERLPEGDA